MLSSWKGTIPIYINNRNWLSPTRAMAEYFGQIPRTEVIIIDNASSYEPLLDWYSKDCPFKVIRLSENVGCHAAWTSGAVLPPAVHRAWFGSDYYVVTDPDLDFENCPCDVLNVLISGYETYPEITKVGVSLEIADIPNNAISARDVVQWESQFWGNRRDERFFNAAIDTTFALYGTGVPCTGNCLRADRPYTVRHIPWYFTPESLSSEQTFYLQNSSGGHWSTIFQKKLLRDTSTQSREAADFVESWCVTEKDRERFAPDWAISRELQSALAKLLQDFRPKTIMETGPGISTLILQRYAKISSDVVTTHIEHSETAYESLTATLTDLKLFPNRVYHCPLKEDYYEGIQKLIPHGNPVDLLMLDGPVSEHHRCSPLALDFIRQCVSANTVIIQDDTHRGSESEVVRRIKSWYNDGHYLESTIVDTTYPWRTTALLIPAHLASAAQNQMRD